MSARQRPQRDNESGSSRRAATARGAFAGPRFLLDALEAGNSVVVPRWLGGNRRHRAKTVLTEIGPVEIEVPRNTDSSFGPQIVKTRQRRLTGIDEIVLSLTAKGLRPKMTGRERLSNRHTASGPRT
jgi:hypothetical protein